MEGDNIKDLTVYQTPTTIKDFMKDIIKKKEDDESFYVLDLGVLVKQYHFWKKNLPSIKPYYAVKCNDTKPLMEVLLALGTGFDCASRNEIKRALEIGATPDDIIYANPSKPISHLLYAKDNDISLMTFDSVCELEKVKKHYPEARLVLRIRAEAEKCLIALGGKFGCEPNKAVELLLRANELGLTVVGISFHVGTGCSEMEAYPRAIHMAADIIHKAKKHGFNIEYLDIGGGFPGDSTEMYQKIALRINEALEMEKDTLRKIKLVAEPGRFFACRAFNLATMITSERKSDSCDIYYINNGIYGAFNSVYTEHAVMYPIPLNNQSKLQKKSMIWGQTEMLADKIAEDCWLPELKTGDWLYFENMGAYSTVLAVQFHGFSIPEIHPIINKKEWTRLQKIISLNKQKQN